MVLKMKLFLIKNWLKNYTNQVYKLLEKKSTLTLQKKMKLSVKDFFSQWDPIHRKQWIWSHLLKKSLMDNFSFCAVSTFINTIWDADLADMQLITKFNIGIRFLLCVIDIYSKYTWIIPFLKKTIRITNSFQNFLDKSQTK